jgi:hypothetical protein
MAVPPIVKATLQAAVINAGSNVLAQGIKAYRNDVSILSHLFWLLFYFQQSSKYRDEMLVVSLCSAK